MANLCSSPPDSKLISLSITWFSSGRLLVINLRYLYFGGLTQDIEDFFQVTHLSPALDQSSNCFIRPFDCLGYLINILWFDDSFEVIL